MLENHYSSPPCNPFCTYFCHNDNNVPTLEEHALLFSRQIWSWLHERQAHNYYSRNTHSTGIPIHEMRALLL